MASSSGGSSRRLLRRGSSITPEAFAVSTEAAADLPDFDPLPPRDSDDESGQPYLQADESCMELRCARSNRSELSSESDRSWHRAMSDTTYARRRDIEDRFGLSESLGHFHRSVSEGIPQRHSQLYSPAAFDVDMSLSCMPPHEYHESAEKRPVDGSPDSEAIELVRYRLDRYSCLAFAGYVLITANDSVIKDWSKGGRASFPYAVSSVMLGAAVASFSIGLLAALGKEGVKGVRFDPFSVVKVARVNVFFQIAGFLKFAALTKVTPDAVSILSQMNLFLLALAVRQQHKKAFSTEQWLSLTMICCGVVLYMSSREGQTLWIASVSFLAAASYVMYKDTGKSYKRRALALALLASACTLTFLSWPQQWSPLGVESAMTWSAEILSGCLCILGMCCCETLASVFLELFFKEKEGADPQPFPIQKMHVDCSSILFSWCWFACNHWGSPFDLFEGWDGATIVVLLVMVCKAWLAGLVAKFLDSVMKQVASCMAIALMFLEMNFFGNPFASYEIVISVATVVLAILNFTICSFKKDKKEDEDKKDVDKKDSDKKDEDGKCTNDDHNKWPSNYKGLLPRSEKRKKDEDQSRSSNY